MLPRSAQPSVWAGKPVVMVASCWFGDTASGGPFQPFVYSGAKGSEPSWVSAAMSSFVFTPTACHAIFPEQCSHLFSFSVQGQRVTLWGHMTSRPAASTP